MSRLELLYRLQEVDTELDLKHRRLGEVEGRLGETEELCQTRARLQEARAAYRQRQTRLQDLELKMAALENKIKGSEQRLYSGAIKNPKELESLHEELAYLRRRKNAEEDDLLEAMISVEDHEAALENAEAKWKAVEATWMASQAELCKERDDLLSRLAELSDLRSVREKAVEKADLHIYEDLRQRKGGTAIARLQRNLCLSCHVEVPSSLAQQARRGDKLIFCGSCGRILHAGA